MAATPFPIGVPHIQNSKVNPAPILYPSAFQPDPIIHIAQPSRPFHLFSIRHARLLLPAARTRVRIFSMLLANQKNKKNSTEVGYGLNDQGQMPTAKSGCKPNWKLGTSADRNPQFQ